MDPLAVLFWRRIFGFSGSSGGSSREPRSMMHDGMKTALIMDEEQDYVYLHHLITNAGHCSITRGRSGILSSIT
jgi:hypothetical protein